MVQMRIVTYCFLTKHICGQSVLCWKGWPDEVVGAFKSSVHDASPHICREGRGDQTPRDAFLRPMVDLQGIKYRLGFNSEKASQEIQEEFDENRWESQEALKYFGESGLLQHGSLRVS